METGKLCASGWDGRSQWKFGTFGSGTAALIARHLGMHATNLDVGSGCVRIFAVVARGGEYTGVRRHGVIPPIQFFTVGSID